MASDTADAVSALVRGLGHAWRFSADGYSSKGLAPNEEPDGGPAYNQTGPPTVSGAKGVAFDINEYIEWTPTGLDALTGDFTLLVRRNAGTWVHHVIRKQGGSTTTWDNGSTPGGATGWLTVNSSGVLKLGDGTAQTFADLVALPFAIPDSWVAPLYNSTRAFPERPMLEVNGDLVSAPATPIQMRGRVDAEEIAPHVDTNGEQLDGRRVNFTLEEV